MKKFLLTIGLLLSLCTGTVGADPGGDGQHERKTTQAMRPVKRSQLKFALLRAAQHNDSCWLVVEIEIPHRAIRRREKMRLGFALTASGGNEWRAPDTINLSDANCDRQTKAAPEPAIKPDRKRAAHLYYSVKFPAEKWMDGNTTLSVLRTLHKGAQRYNYDDQRLPVRWNTRPEAWTGSEGLPDNELTDRLPMSFVPSPAQ